MEKENKKPLYQPWNEEEFQSDVFVRGMSHVQRWMYRSLLQASFFHTTRPFLPNDDRILWVLAGCESRQQWLDNKTDILERFTAVEGEPGLLENKRVTKDWNNLLEIREKMAALGRKSAQARSQETETNDDSTGAERPLNGRLIVVNDGTTREEKLSEVKVSKEKKSEPNTSGGEDLQPRQNQGCDWSNLRQAYRRIFRKKPDKARFGRKYEEVCRSYSEEIVIACFTTWADSCGDVVKAFDHPLFSFFKKLPDLAADEIESQAEEKAEVVEAEKEKEKQAAEKTVIEENIRRQELADWERMNATPPPENGASVLEYISDLETQVSPTKIP